MRLAQWEEALGHAHNIYLNVLGETGIVGFAAYLLLWGGLTIWVVRGIRRAQPGSWTAALALGVLGVIVHMSLHNFFDNLFVQGIYIQLALWIGCLVSIEQDDRLMNPADIHMQLRQEEKSSDVRRGIHAELT